MLIGVLSVYAQAHTRLTPETTHFITLHGDLGLATLMHNISGQQTSFGVNPIVGVDYRLFHNDFLFSVGIEASYGLYINRMDDRDEVLRMMDTEGDLFDMHIHVDRSRDKAHAVNLNIPLYVGGEWKRFYFLVGPKLSVNLYGATSSTALVTTYGDYERYYDDFYDMPNHQFISGQQMGSGVLPMKWNFNVMAHAEIGGRVSHFEEHQQFRLHPDKYRMYLAFFVDFGVLNVHYGAGGAPMFDYRETEQGVQFYIQPLMLSSVSTGAAFRNLHVGVKYTVAFELPKHGKSYIYDGDINDRIKRKRLGNQSMK